MSANARIVALLLMVSAATAGPAGETRKTLANDNTRDLMAESSEIIPEAVAAPSNIKARVQQPDSSAEADETDEHSIELLGGSQTFFPSFANLFEPRHQPSNFRLGFGNQEGAFSQRPNSYRSLLNYPLFGNYRNFDGFSKSETQSSAPLVDATNNAVLGSGNFGIIRGGTFGAQNDEDPEYDGFNSYYNNGHGRPSFGVGYIANPRPNYNQDQFANFKDFADINTPNSAYSHFVVVYANKNATMDDISEETRKVVSKPKNIIETLESLGEEEMKSPPKISKSKAKLEATKQKMFDKKEQWKRANTKYFSQKHDPEEPLLALS